ncbi:MAG: 3-isopropylmalate dehydratase small subunit [Candidatus Dormibacteraceae bacterium]
MVPLERADVDTDQIIPKQFLRRIERTGFGPFLFHDWRKDPDFVLNQPQYQGASVLVAGPNFGCGSSREHAAWSLEDAGFRAVIAPSFGDIFRGNSMKIGMLPVILPAEQVAALQDLAREDPATEVKVDLEAQRVTAGDLTFAFEIDAFNRRCLLLGLDEIALTLAHEADIAAYEARRPAWLPALEATAGG